MKKILFDQCTLDNCNRKKDESMYVLQELNSCYKDDLYLIKEHNITMKDMTIEYMNDIIEYSKDELRKNPIKTFEQIFSSINISSLSDLLVISSDQEFLYLFNNIPVKTCLIYKNKLDCMEINPTFEFKELDSVKKLVLK